MKIAMVPSSWIPESGLRLHAGPFASGSIALRRRLRELGGVPLASLTKGPYGGIYTPPIHNFKRTYVDSPRDGVPFIGTTTMMHADFVGVPLLSKQQAFSEKYRILRIEEGMTLISCSGTIGRVVYVRPDMAGMWSSGDTLKILPNPDLIDPGYLHAFLSSAAGVRAMVAETYGSIVPHIEAGHVASLPVPRPGERVERMTGDLVRRAAAARTEARELLARAQQSLRATVLVALGVGSPDDCAPAARWSSTASSDDLQRRMDAYYYSPPCLVARAAFDSAVNSSTVRLGKIADVFIPGIFKRRYASDPKFGYPYLTGADVFQIAPTADRYLVKSVAEEHRLVVPAGTILVQEAGQLGGLIGRSVLVGSHFAGAAVSNNMVRIRCESALDTGYLYALLSTDEGATLIAREAAGSSIPHIDVGRVRNLELPWATDEIRGSVGSLVVRALQLREAAAAAAIEALATVDRFIGDA